MRFIIVLLLFLAGCACEKCIRFSFDNGVFLTDGVDMVQLYDPCEPVECP